MRKLLLPMLLGVIFATCAAMWPLAANAVGAAIAVWSIVFVAVTAGTALWADQRIG